MQRVRHETRHRKIEVVRVKPLSPNFVGVTFTGEELEGFLSLSFDDHFKFMLESAEAQGNEPSRLPAVEAGGGGGAGCDIMGDLHIAG